ncbi:TolC family protein [Reichenbachiella carrageenanivorans]|uniref:TolC family protein n=1 Tax=Reichenbachiella carrageenanivorans TaxID=2979869 RepID=A0ABY6D5I0_9BACT|nr:TolC family protein [Reichenbachiella carrageenanivorans]UXX81079.1 TolC family protein [Reichenbachiella carrageenanivorans]
MNKLLTIILVICAFETLAQEQYLNQLSLNEFYELVRTHHPIAKQAGLILERGEAVVSQARGAFDPKLVSEFQTKQFQGKNYYDVWDSYVKIPTALNVDLKAGYERNRGQYLNPEHTVPSDGLYYAGISVPIGQGLIHNSRNIDLKKSMAEQKNLASQANAVYNNLLLDANYVYWNWFEAYQKMKVAEASLALITERFNGIRAGVFNGDKASIDSVESLIQVQSWKNELNKSKLDFQNAGIQMENFIWDSTQVHESHPDTVWQKQDILVVDEYINYAISNHPDLKALQANLMTLELDKKMSAENIKPVLNLNYNFLMASGSSDEAMSGLSNNYKGGFEFSFPLLVRKERAKLKQAKLKLEEGGLKLTNKSRVVTNKVFQSYGKLIVLLEMLEQQRLIVQNYKRLLEGERVKFRNGESSIFLVNSRENKKIEAEMKLVNLEAEYGRAVGMVNWSSGYFVNQLQSGS